MDELGALRPLIRQEGHLNDVACVNWTPGPPWAAYAHGYLRAARLLFREGQPNRSDNDRLIYPIAMLYRHAIELTLKQIGLQANRFLAQSAPFIATHNLSSLWNRCQQAYLKVSGDDGSTLRELNRTITALHHLDPNGEAFRYPLTRDAQPTIPQEIRSIDLDYLTRAFEDIVDALEGILCSMSESADVFAELARDFPETGDYGG